MKDRRGFNNSSTQKSINGRRKGKCNTSQSFVAFRSPDCAHACLFFLRSLTYAAHVTKSWVLKSYRTGRVVELSAIPVKLKLKVVMQGDEGLKGRHTLRILSQRSSEDGIDRSGSCWYQRLQTTSEDFKLVLKSKNNMDWRESKCWFKRLRLICSFENHHLHSRLFIAALTCYNLSDESQIQCQLNVCRSPG